MRLLLLFWLTSFSAACQPPVPAIQTYQIKTIVTPLLSRDVEITVQILHMGKDTVVLMRNQANERELRFKISKLTEASDKQSVGYIAYSFEHDQEFGFIIHLGRGRPTAFSILGKVMVMLKVYYFDGMEV